MQIGAIARIMKSSNDYLNITTDDTLRETVRHGDSRYPFAYYVEDVWQFDFHCVDWHWHHELEFISMAEGTQTCLVGTDEMELPQGYGLFINSGILHRFEAAGRVLMPNIVFSPALLAEEKSLIYEKYVQPVTHSAAACQILDPHVGWQKKILQLLEDIYSLQEEPNEKKELQTMQFLLQMWEILYGHLDLTLDMSNSHRLNHKQARLRIMMQYIHDHYREELTLEEIAASASIGKSGALHLFQSGIHMPPVAYLIQYRLTRAAELLHTTEKPVSVIAGETGFSSAGYFCRKFKERYGITPNEYRRKNF